MERMGRGRGYLDDHSMSVNASEAYERGEMPLSRWTKARILQGIRRQVVIGLHLEERPLEALKIYALEETCEHHTSKLFNSTTFYQVRPEIADSSNMDCDMGKEFSRLMRAFDELAAKKLRDKIMKGVRTKARVSWDEWDQRGKRFVHFESWAVLSGPWAYCERGKRKKVDGSHFEVLATYTRAPRGAGDVFRRLMALVPSGK